MEDFIDFLEGFLRFILRYFRFLKIENWKTNKNWENGSKTEKIRVSYGILYQMAELIND